MAHSLTMCVEPKLRIGCFQMPLLLPYHLYVTSTKIVWHLTLMRPRTLIKNFKSFNKTCKNKWYVLNYFLSFIVFFLKSQSFHHFGIDVEPLFTKGWGWSFNMLAKRKPNRL
jgi:hypothetical protein